MPWREATEEQDGKMAAVMGCHVWTGYVDPQQGYPILRTKTSSTTAAKALWEKENGPVPEGKKLGSLCGNRLCVRPRHREPMTPRQIAYSSGSTGLNPADQMAIRVQVAGGTPIAVVARRYQVERRAIYQVLRGEYYRPPRSGG